MAPRPRVNQPVGFPQGKGYKPKTYIGRSHTYIYYPIGWTDSTSGRQYESGYYDENGQRYENVSFREKDGSYKNVLCQCEYCGTQKVMDLTSADTKLTCDACGGNMKIVGNLDEVMQEGEGTGEYKGASFEVGDGNSQGSRVKKLILRIIGVICAVNILSTLFSNCAARTGRNGYTPVDEMGYWDEDEDHSTMYGDNGNSGSQETSLSNVDIFGNTIHLQKNADGSFSIEKNGLDKTISWQDDYESYYDSASDCYLWYNNEVDPPVWQYWYEGISSDFGDNGWMEYDASTGKWWIEESYDNWIELPDRYSTENLWHIQ